MYCIYPSGILQIHILYCIGASGTEGNCRQEKCKKISTPLSYTSIEQYSDQALQEAIVQQPVAVALSADTDDFQFVSIVID